MTTPLQNLVVPCNAFYNIMLTSNIVFMLTNKYGIVCTYMSYYYSIIILYIKNYTFISLFLFTMKVVLLVVPYYMFVFSVIRPVNLFCYVE